MRARQFIIREYSRDVTAQKLGAALLQKFRKEPAQWQHRVTGAATDYDDHALQYLLELVEKADPTKNKQYVPWIIRVYINSPSLKFEDAVTKITEPLTKFFKLVQKRQIPAPNNDIGRIRDLAQLVQLVDQYPDVVDQPKDAERGQAKELYRDADIRIIVPEDQQAACYYGQGTRWCTAATQNNMFDRYYKEGYLYIILPQKPLHTGEKYQLHFATKQFMNEEDRRVNLTDLVERFPQLRKVFHQQAKNYNIYSLLFSKQELESRAGAVNNRLLNEIPKYIERTADEKALDIAIEVMRSNSIIKRFVDRDELYESMAEDLRDNSRSLVQLIISSVDGLEMYSDEDAMSDIMTDVVSDWTRGQYFWELLEDLENEDPEAFFDAAMTIDGEISSWMTKVFDEMVSNSPELKS